MHFPQRFNFVIVKIIALAKSSLLLDPRMEPKKILFRPLPGGAAAHKKRGSLLLEGTLAKTLFCLKGGHQLLKFLGHRTQLHSTATKT